MPRFLHRQSQRYHRQLSNWTELITHWFFADSLLDKACSPEFCVINCVLLLIAFVPNIPGGGLDFHEAAGGHTLEKHVGKTEAELAQRLASEKRISAASSFTYRSVAEAAIAEAMSKNQSAIDSWVKSRSNRYTIDYNANKIIRITMRRGASKATQTSRLRIVLQRSTKLPPGYFILTA